MTYYMCIWTYYICILVYYLCLFNIIYAKKGQISMSLMEAVAEVAQLHEVLEATNQLDDEPLDNPLKEPLANIMLTMDKPGNVKKQVLTMKHFSHFLKVHYKKDITEITTVDQLDSDLFGKYTTYLAEKATVNRKEGWELVAYLTCLGYLSAAKKHFQKNS